MERSRGLFLVLDGLVSRCQRTGRMKLVQGLEASLKDFRALGYRIIGVMTGGGYPEARGCGFEFDDVWVAAEGEGGFAPAAWSLARRHSLNVRRSLLCSLDEAHEGWARDAGLRRFETPTGLFGVWVA